MPAAPAKSKQPPPLGVIERAKSLGIDQVIVGVSCGKDSIATLDLCHKHLSRVAAYFLYLVPGLSFQERYLSYLERRYAPLQILRLPHWSLSRLFRGNTFRFVHRGSYKTRILHARDTDAYLRQQTGIDWIATGEKACDSVERNAMIRRVDGVDTRRRRFWPLAYWQQASTYNHLKTNAIALPPDYSLSAASFQPSSSCSFGDLWYRDIAWVKERYPADFAKIVELFPLLPAQLIRYAEREKREQREKQEKENGQKESS